MIDIKQKKDCCGCTACYSICPKNAIIMEPDNEGFLYPKVNKKKCINCNLCMKVCPIIKENINNNKIMNAYAVRLKNKKDLMDSTSGGFFTAIANYIIKKHGIIYGVGYDKNFKIVHKRATNKFEIIEMRGSKYVQSYLGETFKNIKKDLNNHKIVLFTGTPCQIQGLKKFLISDFDNLITMDLICHGVPSPLLWEKYIDYHTNQKNTNIKSIKFRNKTYGYHSGTMKIEFENGKTYYGSARVDYYLKSFFKEISSRPSCYDCKFKNKIHISDFTVFDCWNYVKNIKEKDDKNDDDLGYTNLFINTEKGLNIIPCLSNYITMDEINIDKAIENDGSMVENSVKKHPKRDEYYDYLNNHSLAETVEKYIPVSKKDLFIEKNKKLLYEMKVIQFLKKIKNKIKEGK